MNLCKILWVSLFAVTLWPFHPKPAYAEVNDLKPAIAVIGASFAEDHWPLALYQGTESEYSRNSLIKGRYAGLCNTLQLVYGLRAKVICKAEAGATAGDLDLTLDMAQQEFYTFQSKGLMSQFQEAVKACSWNQMNLCKVLVVTLPNEDGLTIDETALVVQAAHQLGMRVIVQMPPQIADFQREYALALTLHGAFWGNVIRKVLTQNGTQPVLTPEQYAFLRAAHSQALSSLADGYFDFYAGSTVLDRYDGVHPYPYLNMLAAQRLAAAINTLQ